jgi:hypothetical protein
VALDRRFRNRQPLARQQNLPVVEVANPADKESCFLALAEILDVGADASEQLSGDADVQ